MDRILENIRVIEVSVWLQGPIAGAHLADMGAEVIKVEPLQGEVARGLISMKAVPMNDWNWYFDSTNRNKKSIAVDLRKEVAQEIVHKLIQEADVFLANISRRALKNLALDYETLRKINPRLIYAVSSGYGRHGPDADKPSYDATAQARVGIMNSLGEPGQPPIYTGLGSGDVLGGLFTASAIVLALYEREKSGQGQELDVSLLGAQIAMSAPKLQAYLATKDDYYLHQHSRKEVKNPFWNVYPTKDGWIYLCMQNTDDIWHALCKALDAEEFEVDIRFDNSEKRQTKASTLIPLIDKMLSAKKSEEWMEQWDGLGLVAGPVNTFAEFADDPQAWENGYLHELYHPVLGKDVKTRGFPVQFGKTPGEIRSWAPELGQHTEEILTELLEYSWEQVGELKDADAII